MQTFFSKSDMAKKFYFKIWHVVKFTIQNFTRCKFRIRCRFCLAIFDALSLFHFKNWHVAKFLFQNLVFKTSFQILAVSSSKFYQHQRTTCWKVTAACGFNFCFECVAFVCLTFGIFFIGFCVNYSNWFVDRCKDFIIYATNWFLQISLQCRKLLVYGDFFLKILN